nr:MAG TPA: hypothetical protein [Caudoviricetes sp.]
MYHNFTILVKHLDKLIRVYTFFKIRYNIIIIMIGR